MISAFCLILVKYETIIEDLYDLSKTKNADSRSRFLDFYQHPTIQSNYAVETDKAFRDKLIDSVEAEIGFKIEKLYELDFLLFDYSFRYR